MAVRGPESDQRVERPGHFDLPCQTLGPDPPSEPVLLIPSNPPLNRPDWEAAERNRQAADAFGIVYSFDKRWSGPHC